MKTSTKILLGTAFIFALTLSGFAASAQATYNAPKNDAMQDFHIDKDGYVTIYQAQVYQISGTSFYLRYYVGLAFIRILVKTEAITKVFRRFGDEITLKQINPGDVINVEGKIENGADTLSLIATKITNFSNQKEISGFSGIVSGTGSTTGSFILNTKNQGMITLNTSSTTQIRKGSRIITTDLVHNGDQVTSTVGTFDHSNMTLAANVIVIYTDMKVFAERNFQGTLKAVSQANPPILTVNAEGKDYSVMGTANTAILNTKRSAVSIQRFVVGDTIRIYGNIREAENPIIDAQIIRNISL